MCAVHPIFHISQLEPAIPNTILDWMQPPLPLVEVDGEPEFEISEILDSKVDHWCKLCKLLYLVRWSGYKGTDEETSWLLASVDKASGMAWLPDVTWYGMPVAVHGIGHGGMALVLWLLLYKLLTFIADNNQYTSCLTISTWCLVPKVDTCSLVSSNLNDKPDLINVFYYWLMLKGASRSWWWDCFINHPAFKEWAWELLTNPDAKISNAKPKVMCLPVRINQESVWDCKEIHRGAHQEMRDDTTVIDWCKYGSASDWAFDQWLIQVWSTSTSDPNKQWLTG